MAEHKTRPTAASVEKFLAGIKHKGRAADARAVLELMQEVTGEPPVMWGPSIVGFGSYHYRYDSGREGDFLRMGFSPRAQALTLYIMGGFPQHEALLARLGPHSTGASCLYLKRLDEVDGGVLKQLLRASWKEMAKRYPPGKPAKKA